MAAFSSCKFSCDLDSGSGECDEHHSAISMGWIRSMIDPYAANPDHHRKIYRTVFITLHSCLFRYIRSSCNTPPSSVVISGVTCSKRNTSPPYCLTNSRASSSRAKDAKVGPIEPLRRLKAT